MTAVLTQKLSRINVTTPLSPLAPLDMVFVSILLIIHHRPPLADYAEGSMVVALVS